ncbi:MAG: serine/threonine-protein kinase [Candidatus Obscuribacterales bacterium]
MSIAQPNDYLNERLVGYATIAALFLAVASFVLGATVTYGWVADNNLFKHMFLNGPVVWSSVGINTLFLGIAICLLLVAQEPSLSRPLSLILQVVATILCSIVFLAGLSTAIETLAGLDLSLNHIWYRANEDSSGLSFPGPMTPDVSFAFMALTAAVAIQTWFSSKRTEVAQWLCVAALMITSLPLIGAVSGAESLCTFFGCLRMSEGISFLFIVMSSACFLIKSDKGLAGFLCSNTASALVARRATLLVVFLPVLFGLRFALVHFKIVDNALGWAIFALGAIALAVALVVTGVKSAEQLMASAAGLAPSPFFSQTGSMVLGQPENLEFSINVGPGIIKDQIERSSSHVRKVCLACEKEIANEAEVCPFCDSVLTRLINKSLVGQIFADKYEVMWQLGDGGMASVYLAKHLYLPQELAVKILHAAVSSNIHDVKRFQQEAKALGTLNHPNIVAVRDFGFTASGEAFLAMEYVKGFSLSDLIEKSRGLTVQETAAVMLQVCDALLHAHGAGIVHRDLKPSNIMCSPSQNGKMDVKVVDFGLAKITGRDDVDIVELTRTGECYGSPPYMSPEQCKSEPVDFRSDIYALGCILYECLVGKSPFVAGSIYDTLTMQVSSPAPDFPSALAVPLEYRNMVMKALAKKPDERQNSVDEIKQVLLKLA